MLYTTFHTNPPGIRRSARRVSLFSNVLVLRPELGRFVKRLSLAWSDKDEKKNYKIISRCPSMFIFSSLLPHRSYKDRRPWWGQGLPKTIRSFDADVYKIPVNDILSLVEVLPHLEVLHLKDLTGCLVRPAPVCLTTLRILSMYYYIFDGNTSSSPPVSDAMQLPALTTLATNVGLVHARLSLPLDALRGLEYVQVVCRSDYHGHHSDYFDNLRYLEITTFGTSFQDCLTYFPFHQLECLTVNPTLFTVQYWKETVEDIVAMPLDAKAMPKLKLFQLIWGITGIYGYYNKDLDGIGEREDFIEYFEGLVRRFEQQNVLFVETNEFEICPGFQHVRDVLIACNRS